MELFADLACPGQVLWECLRAAGTHENMVEAQKLTACLCVVKFHDPSLKKEFDSMNDALTAVLGLDTAKTVSKDDLKAIHTNLESDASLRSHKGLDLLPLGRFIMKSILEMVVAKSKEETLLLDMNSCVTMMSTLTKPEVNDLIIHNKIRLTQEPLWKDAYEQLASIVAKADKRFQEQFHDTIQMQLTLLADVRRVTRSAYQHQFKTVTEECLHRLRAVCEYRSHNPDKSVETECTSVLDAARQVDDVSKGPLSAISNPEDPDLVGELALYKQRKEMMDCFASVAGPVVDKTFAIRSPQLIRLAAVLASNVCCDNNGDIRLKEMKTLFLFKIQAALTDELNKTFAGISPFTKILVHLADQDYTADHVCTEGEFQFCRLNYVPPPHEHCP